MLSLSAPSTQDRVYLIDEYRCWLVVPSQVEQHLYQLFGISTPLAYDSGCADVEKGCPALSGTGLSQHRLTRTRRSK